MSLLSKFLLTGTLMGAISLPFILPHLSKTPPASCGCYAEAATSSTPPTQSPSTCGACDVDGCNLDPGEFVREKNPQSPYYAWRCINWDSNPVGHCAWTQRIEFEVWISFIHQGQVRREDTGANCFKWRCSAGIPRNDAPCYRYTQLPGGKIVVVPVPNS